MLGRSTGEEKGRSGGVVSDLIGKTGWLAGGDGAVLSTSDAGGVIAASPKETAEGGLDILAKGSSSRNGVGELLLKSSGITRDLDFVSTEGAMDDEPEDPGGLGADCERIPGKLEGAVGGWGGVDGGDCRNAGRMMECKDRRFFNGILNSKFNFSEDLLVSTALEEIFAIDS